MAINFNQNSTFNLKPINKESVRGEVMGLLVNGEEIAYAFQTVRDQLIFTNKRIIAVDVQGITGKRKSFTTLPYSKIQYFQFRHRDLWKHSLIQNCSLCFPVALRQPLNLRKKWM